MSLTLLVDVRLNVPVSVLVAGLVVLGAGHLNLLEAPLGKVDVAGAQVASQNLMLQAEGRGERADLAAVARRGVADDLNLPVVLLVSDRQVAIAGDFLVRLGDRGADLVRVKVTAGLHVNQADRLAVTDKAGLSFGVEVDISAVGVEEPVVVGILVVVAGDLLLARSLGVRLDVAVKQATAVAHVLDCDARTKGDLQGAVPADFSALEIGLEERRHLGISRSAVGEDGKVNGEAEHVDQDGQDDETNDSCHNVGSQNRDGHLGVAKLPPQVLNGVKADERRDEETDELDAAYEADAEASHEQPEEPLGLERPLALAVELGPAESGGDGAEEKHRVQEDEAADGGVRVLAEDHQGDEPDSGAAEVEFLCGPVGHGHAHGAPEGVELAHKGVVDLLGVGFAGFELEGSIVAGEISAEADKQLSGGGMDVKVEFALEVVASKLAKTVGDKELAVTLATAQDGLCILSLVPRHDGGESDLVEAREEGYGREEDGGNEPLPLVEDLEEGGGLSPRHQYISQASRRKQGQWPGERRLGELTFLTFFLSSASTGFTTAGWGAPATLRRRAASPASKPEATACLSMTAAMVERTRAWSCRTQGWAVEQSVSRVVLGLGRVSSRKLARGDMARLLLI